MSEKEIMYGPTLPISKETHRLKYRQEGESFRESMSRVANALSDDPSDFIPLRSILLTQRFLPAGRIQAAVGSPRKTTAFNCFVSGTIEDSMNGIMDKAKDAAQTMRLGGGIGYDFSTIRPKEDLIVSLGSKASGVLSFMEIYDTLCKTVSSAGNRRGAQMGVLRVDHPDIEEFIEAKTNDTTLTKFNISVGITDDFMHAVKNDEEFSLKFNGRVYKRVQAKYLWDKIMRATWDWAEPGVLFIDRINEMNNLNYCETIAATNPCVHPSTLILTDKGYQKIGELEGVQVNVWNGEEFSPTVVKETGQDQKMKMISFSDGSHLECTHGHKFYLSNGKKVEANELGKGDKLLKSHFPVIEGDVGLHQAYEQGFFSGDGWFKGSKAYIGLYGEKKKLLSKFSGAKSINEYNIVGGYDGTDTTETKLYLYYGEKGFYWNKSWVPARDFNLESRKEWLTGLMDSDGHVTKDGNAQISSKDREFLLKVKLLLNTMGATGTLSKMKDCWRLSIPASYYYKLELDGRHPAVKPSRECTPFVKVVDIEEGEVCEKVYCFTESKRHMGVFNGVLTGQCGEQPLPPYGACLLGSFNLIKYCYTDDSNKFNFDLLTDDIPIVVKAMDNVIDQTTYPLPEQEKEAKSKRRMGLGVTGLANAGEFLGLVYGSKEFIEFTDKVLDILANTAYLASTELATTKGMFPLFDRERYTSSKFIQSLWPATIKAIKDNGIRNSHLTSIAPTGTISLSADNISSGIEPVFSHEYDRTIQTENGPVVERVTDYAYREFGIKGKTADECTVGEHLDVLISVSKHVDSAVSKTLNVGDKVTWQEFKEIYERAWEEGCKGCTTFRVSGKRYGVLNKIEPESSSGEACYYDTVSGKKTCE